MTKKILRTTTGLALVVSLTVPTPILAQGTFSPCGPGIEAPCLLEDGTVLTEEAAREADTAAESGTGAEASSNDQDAADPNAEAETEVATEAEIPSADEINESEAAAEEAAKAELEAAQAAAEEDAKAADAAAKAELEAAQQAAEDDAKAAEAAAKAELEAAQAAAEEDAKAAEAAAKAELEAAQAAAEEEAKAADEAEKATGEAATTVEAAPADAVTTEATEEVATDEPIVIEEPETIISEDTGLTEEAAAAEAATAEAVAEEAPSAAAVAAVEGEATIDEQPEVTTTTVTAADVRSSDEEFETRAQASDRTTKDQNTAAMNDDGGLSNLEKMLLAAGGIAVIGALLNNGSRVVDNTGDRVVAQRDDGSIYVLKDDDALVRRPGDTVQTRTFNDGSTITNVTKPNGETVRTIRDAQGRVLRRSRILSDGSEYLLFDDTAEVEKVDVSTLPRIRSDRVDYADEDAALEAALNRALGYDVGRRFSLSQIRNIRAVRELVPQIDLEAITFDSGSAAIRPSEAEKLARLGNAMRKVISDRPDEVFLIEGHTDTVGSAVSNLTLSDRRAESLALALSEYFDIPPENLVVQGYGESYLRVAREGDLRANRRVAVRRITPLLGIQTTSR